MRTRSTSLSRRVASAVLLAAAAGAQAVPLTHALAGPVPGDQGSNSFDQAAIAWPASGEADHAGSDGNGTLSAPNSAGPEQGSYALLALGLIAIGLTVCRRTAP